MGMLTVMLGKAAEKNKGKESDSGDAEAEVEGEAQKSAAEDFLAAMKKEDAGAVIEAFKALSDACDC